MKGRALVKLMKEQGWVLDRVSGSHHIMVKEGRRPVPVPVHVNKDLNKSLLHGILKEAGIK